MSSPPCSIILFWFFLFFRTHLAPVFDPSLMYDRQFFLILICPIKHSRGRRGHDRMVVALRTTCAITTYHHALKLWVQTPLRRGALDTTLCDKVCHWLTTGRWVPLDTPVSSTNKIDRHHITEILLKVALRTINRIFYF